MIDHSVKVSVLMPSYNVADYIDECIKSVLSQDFSEIELLCLDAGSIDGTIDIIEAYAAKDNRISFIKCSKRSYGAQMNIGLRRSRGKYVIIVETDDYVTPNMISTLYKSAEKNEAEMVKGAYFKVYESKDGRRVERAFHYIPARVREGVPFSPYSDLSIHLWDPNIWCGIYRTDFLKNNAIEFHETRGAAFQDIGFKHRVLSKAKRIMYIDTPLYYYRLTRNEASTWNNQCLYNTYYEYSSLLEDKQIGIEHKSYIYARLAASFLHEYDKVLQMADYDEKQLSQIEEYKTWFRSAIKNVYYQNRGSALWISDDNDRILSCFLRSEEEYIANRKEMRDCILNWQRKILSMVKRGGIVVVGCSQIGKHIIEFEHKNGVLPLCVADNNFKLWGTEFISHTVCSLLQSIEKYPACGFVIACKNSKETIRRQLRTLGVQEDRIMNAETENEIFCKAIAFEPVLL